METISAETSKVQRRRQQLLASEQKQTTMKVLVAVDENDDSFYALRWVLDKLFMKQERQDRHLVLLHVMQSFPPYAIPGAPAVFPTSVVGSVNKFLRQSATILLSSASQICSEKKVVTETVILEGDPKDKICGAIEQIHADLLVVGSRGLGKVNRALLGSVSDYCAHNANCPIIIVKPPKESDK